ncbi:MAG: DNA polymerase, partial [Methanobrevibacter sp.]|nr:DNA polymerase [Methanobrevibacter sp.]
MQENVVILDIDYVTYEEKPVIRLFSKKGDENIILIDDTFEPYLYVMSDDVDECVSEIEDNIDVVCVEKVIKKDFQIESEFVKVTFRHPQELAKNRDALRDLESVIQIREFDIPFYRRYLMDRDVIPMTEVIAVGEELEAFMDLDSTKQDIKIIRLTDRLERVKEYPQNFRILSF